MRPPARSSGDQGWRGRLLPPPRAPPRPGEAQGCSPGAHLLATEDTQQGGGAHREWKHSARGLTCGRTGHPVCLERVALVAPAEAPGPWVGPTILLAVAIVVGANQLALLVCGHRAQLTRPLVRAGSLVAAPPWARGQACTEEGDTLQTIQEGETGPGGPGSEHIGHWGCGTPVPGSRVPRGRDEWPPQPCPAPRAQKRTGYPAGQHAEPRTQDTQVEACEGAEAPLPPGESAASRPRSSPVSQFRPSKPSGQKQM